MKPVDERMSVVLAAARESRDVGKVWLILSDVVLALGFVFAAIVWHAFWSAIAFIICAILSLMIMWGPADYYMHKTDKLLDELDELEELNELKHK